MVEQDTIRLLRECDAGVKMGISSIDDVLDKVKSDSLRQYLADCRNEHVRLQEEVDVLLENYQDDGKEPNPIAKGMSWVKTNVKLAVEESDETIADLMTDGCNMGVKSLNKYLNEYEAANEKSKDICKKLINLEQKLTTDIRGYL
jgi:phage shock protein A